MAFNSGAPFGAPAQPAFGQASETPQPANPFGQTAAATSSPAFGSRITFGAAARTSKSPGTDAVATSPFGTGFGSSTGFGSGTGFGSVAGQSSAHGSMNAFGTAAAPQQGFGANTGTFRAAGQSDTQAVPSQPLFAQLQTSQAQPAALNPFARLGNIAGSNSQNDLSQAQPSQTEPAAPSPFDRLGNTAASSSQNGFQAQTFGTSLSVFGTKPQDQSAQPLFGQSAQPKPSAGFGNTVSGTNPFAAATSGIDNPFASTATVPPAKGLAFGRAAKSKPQQQQQPASVSGQQAQQQGEFSAGVQSQQNIGQSTKQKQKPQASTPSNELLDPAALAARNARFASKQASQASPFPNASPALNRPASPTTGQDQKRIASQPDLRHSGT